MKHTMNIKCILYILSLSLFFVFLEAKAQGNNSENISYDEKILFLEDMQNVQVPPHNIEGINQANLYQDKNGKLWFVKKIDNKLNTQNSLVSSYLASKLINFILPGSAPLILPVLEKKTGKVFIASLMLDNFLRNNHKEKRLILLNLILDLLDIQDRKNDNIGGIPNGNEVDAVAIDLDNGLHFQMNWLQNNWINLARSKNIDEVESSLKKIAQISDDSLKTLLFHAVHDLKAIAPRIIPFAKYEFEVMIDFYYIVDQVITTKHEMSYLAQKIELVSKILNSENANYCEDITEDKYSILLQAAIIKNSRPCIQKLFSLGAKDSQGYAMSIALKERNMDIAQQLLDNGAKDSTGVALETAIAKEEWEFAQKLLDLSAKDPEGYTLTLYTCIKKGNFKFAQKLLDHGLQDLRGNALREAIRVENWEFTQKLLDHGSKDPQGYALREAIRVRNWEFAQKLLDHGSKDPQGFALSGAIRAGNFKFAQKLLDHGSYDTRGYALLWAIQLGNFELTQKLLKQNEPDPYKKLLKLIEDDPDFNYSQQHELRKKIRIIEMGVAP